LTLSCVLFEILQINLTGGDFFNLKKAHMYIKNMFIYYHFLWI